MQGNEQRAGEPGLVWLEPPSGTPPLVAFDELRGPVPYCLALRPVGQGVDVEPQEHALASDLAGRDPARRSAR